MDPSSITAQESGASSPSKVDTTKAPPPTPAPTKVGSKFHLKKETPAFPPAVEQAFPQPATDILAAGNQAFIIELKEAGNLGLFKKRSTPKPVEVQLHVTPFYEGIRDTLKGALLRLHKKKAEISDQDFTTRVQSTADALATGCCLMAYLKLRAILLTEKPADYGNSNFKRPRVGADLPIPSPFAFAIQQLGIVNVIDVPSDYRVIPVFPADGHMYGCPLNHPWNSSEYAQAVEYARSVGLAFSMVDLKVKQGTAWWLLRHAYDEEVFELQCVMPESNYTDVMAGAHCLFLKESGTDPSNPFVDLTKFADKIFGVLVVNPHAGVNLTCFEAITESSSEPVG